MLFRGANSRASGAWERLLRSLAEVDALRQSHSPGSLSILHEQSQNLELQRTQRAQRKSKAKRKVVRLRRFAAPLNMAGFPLLYNLSMSTQPASDLRFPIGKFQWSGANTDADRKRFIDEIAHAPGNLRSAVFGLDDAQLDTPYRPGGWTVRQVVHHVPDSHLNAYIRYKLALTEENPLIKAYDEAAWAELPDSREPIENSLVLLESVHRRWVSILRSMKPEDFLRPFQHPELGPVNLDRYVGLYAWHGKHHVAHITALRERNGW